MAEHIELNRTFWPVEPNKEHDPEAIQIMAALGVDQQVSWDKLLEKSRVVILGEPGTGKTEELSAITKEKHL
jgi:type IV secretory pathway ATPase VirB11/archaellum biosynthesis ATPase